MPSPTDSRRAEAARALAARRARFSVLRRRSAVAALATFALAFGVLTLDPPDTTTGTAAASQAATTSTSTPAPTRSDATTTGAGTTAGAATDSAGDSELPAVTTQAS